MKTIIVPTDFSPAALNATNYAADMALAIKANLLLFHVYQLPLSVSDTPIVLLSVEEMNEAAETKLAQLKKRSWSYHFRSIGNIYRSTFG